MKQLELLEQRKFDDEDIQEDIEFLKEKMEASVQDLSSYDEYVTEVSHPCVITNGNNYNKVNDDLGEVWSSGVVTRAQIWKVLEGKRGEA